METEYGHSVVKSKNKYRPEKKDWIIFWPPGKLDELKLLDKAGPIIPVLALVKGVTTCIFGSTFVGATETSLPAFPSKSQEIICALELKTNPKNNTINSEREFCFIIINFAQNVRQNRFGRINLNDLLIRFKIILCLTRIVLQK